MKKSGEMRAKKKKIKEIKEKSAEKEIKNTNPHSDLHKEISPEKPAEKPAEKSRRKISVLGKKIKKEKDLKFINTHLIGFDKLFKKGIPDGSSVLVEGGPGSGKTIFCLNLAKNFCKQGKKVFYMSFEEPESRLRSHMKNFGWKPEEYEKKRLLLIKRFNALDIARSVEALLSEAKKELLIEVQPVLIPKDFEPDVVLMDSLTSIGSAFSGEESRFRIYMEQLFRYLEKHEITSFLIRETSNPTHTGQTFVERGEAVSFLSDGIIVLYNVFYRNGLRKKAVEVLKMRGTEIDTKVVECEIKAKTGIVVYPNRVIKGEYTLT